jgi:hypothetical protein
MNLRLAIYLQMSQSRFPFKKISFYFFIYVKRKMSNGRVLPFYATKRWANEFTNSKFNTNELDEYVRVNDDMISHFIAFKTWGTPVVDTVSQKALSILVSLEHGSDQTNHTFIDFLKSYNREDFYSNGNGSKITIEVPKCADVLLARRMPAANLVTKICAYDFKGERRVLYKRSRDGNALPNVCLMILFQRITVTIDTKFIAGCGPECPYTLAYRFYNRGARQNIMSMMHELAYYDGCKYEKRSDGAIYVVEALPGVSRKDESTNLSKTNLPSLHKKEENGSATVAPNPEKQICQSIERDLIDNLGKMALDSYLDKISSIKAPPPDATIVKSAPSTRDYDTMLHLHAVLSGEFNLSSLHKKEVPGSATIERK